jgi:hypothetical protein
MDARRGFADAQLLIALSRLHEARARLDKLEHAVVDAATQSERAYEKLAYGRFEKEAVLPSPLHTSLPPLRNLNPHNRSRLSDLLSNPCWCILCRPRSLFHP